MSRFLCTLLLIVSVLLFTEQAVCNSPASVTEKMESEQKDSSRLEESRIDRNQNNRGFLKKLNERLDRHIARKSSDAFTRNSLFHKLIPVFTFLMVLFILSVIVITLLVFSIKFYRHYRQRKQRKVWELYKEILISYLNEQNELDVPHFPSLNYTTNRKILIEQLYELANIIYGRKQIKLRYVYRDNNLQPFLLKKIKKGPWPIRALYLKYLSIRPFRGEMMINLSKLTESPNPEVRLYSQLAYISQYSDQALSFLEGYHHTLSEWDQMNLYEAMIQNSIPIPDLYEYLQSGNDSVVVFALRLIRWYYLKNKNSEKLLRLIDHPNEEIRLEAYKTIVELKIRGVDDIFRYHYLNETTAVKKVMIDYFVARKNLRKQMYQEILEIETDPKMLFYLLESYYNQSLNNQQEIKTLKDQTEYPAIRSMCHHIIENAS
ncbi:MAG: hypothetical protein ACOC90_09255 [Bacteroidota bacterium]